MAAGPRKSLRTIHKRINLPCGGHKDPGVPDSFNRGKSPLFYFRPARVSTPNVIC